MSQVVPKTRKSLSQNSAENKIKMFQQNYPVNQFLLFYRIYSIGKVSSQHEPRKSEKYSKSLPKEEVFLNLLCQFIGHEKTLAAKKFRHRQLQPG